VRAEDSPDTAQAKAAALKSRLEPYGLADQVALFRYGDEPLPKTADAGWLDPDTVADSDLLLDFQYGTPSGVVGRFRRSALVDIDPGLLQVWMSQGLLHPAAHDVYFTTGETIGRPGTRIPDLGLPWRYTPPCVALDWWPVRAAPPDAAVTTISHWYAEEW